MTTAVLTQYFWASCSCPSSVPLPAMHSSICGACVIRDSLLPPTRVVAPPYHQPIPPPSTKGSCCGLSAVRDLDFYHTPIRPLLLLQVLQECHAALGMYQGELLQEVAYILRTQHASSPAAARTRQAAMDALRHFGAGGVDAYRQARQQGGVAPGMPSMVQRDPGEGCLLGGKRGPFWGVSYWVALVGVALKVWRGG